MRSIVHVKTNAWILICTTLHHVCYRHSPPDWTSQSAGSRAYGALFSAEDSLYLYGGINYEAGSEAELFGDLWQFNGNGWQEASTSVSLTYPGPR